MVDDPKALPTSALPPIPAKRYFTISEVAELCAVKPHVLRYWEQEFTQLHPMKRAGNRRYYQHHEVLLVRRIRQLIYEEGYTIAGARARLAGAAAAASETEAAYQRLKHETAEIATAIDRLIAEIDEVLTHDPRAVESAA